jgi:hypothetical protein
LLNIIAGSLSVSAAPVLPNSYESIATVALTSTASSISFTSIPQTYTHLQLRYISLDSRNQYEDSPVDMRFNSDSGSNYARHSLYGNGSTAYATAEINQTFIRMWGGSQTNYFLAAVTDILDYTSTSKNKTIKQLFGVDLNGSGEVGLSSGMWFATPAAITSITLTPYSSPFKVNSHFALYGIKGS